MARKRTDSLSAGKPPIPASSSVEIALESLGPTAVLSSAEEQHQEKLDVPDVSKPCRPGDDPLLPVCADHGHHVSYHHPVTAPSLHMRPLGRRLLDFGSNFLMPTTVALILALPCSLVLPIKALFVPVDGWTGSRMPHAPDGKPPLAFILETASFVGAMTVPATLILLGASMARLTVRPVQRVH
jgi:hypothetical protein